MKYIRLSALALAGAMTLSLAACGGSPAATPTPSAPAEETATAPVHEDVTTPSVAPVETAESEPSPSMNVVTPPAETDAVVKPLESQAPVQTAEPTAAPSEAPAADLTAADVYAKVSAVAGGNSKADMGFALTEFYNLSEDDLEDFVFYMPEMSSTNEEIFIAKVSSGKLDAVKSACESRQQGLKEEAGMYPAAAAYVEASKIATSGDWICFVVVEKSDAAVSAFHDAVK